MPYATMIDFPGSTQQHYAGGRYPYAYATVFQGGGLGRVTAGGSKGGYVVKGSRMEAMHRSARRRLGDAAGIIGSVGGAADALVPGSGGIVSSVIGTVASLFGGGASGADLQRQQRIFGLYYQAMTQPGSPSSVSAVQQLYCIATQDSSNNCNNPAATRQYAQTALTRLAQQGWTNVQSYAPQYVGSRAVGSAYGALATNLPAPYGSGSLMLVGLGLVAAYALTRGGGSRRRAA